MYESGRMPQKRTPDPSKMRWNSKLPKGNQHTTPERDEIRELEKEKRATADREFVEGRRALSNALKKDPEAVGRVFEKMVEMAEGGHYKAAELVLGYAYGKPIATQVDGSAGLSGDELFEASAQVSEHLGLTVVRREDEESA